MAMTTGATNGADHTLAVEDLATGYHGRVVGEHLSLTLKGGEVLVLLGPNGSGKTTLFKTVLGLIPRLGGRVMADGVDLGAASSEKRARLFGYVPQVAPGYFPFTVREIVLMGRTPHIGMMSGPTHHDHAVTDAAIERLGLTALAERDFTRISGGERQLALIARALAQNAPFLVMDEPTASLDFANQLKMLALIRTLSAEGLGIIFSTHHPDQALAVATHAALLKDGAIQTSGAARDVLTAERLSGLFGVPLTVAEAAGNRVCVPVGGLAPSTDRIRGH
jgi:iron complex transport system ATP-binding protein